MSGGGAVGKPLTEQKRDWVALLRRVESSSPAAPIAVTKVTLVKSNMKTDLRTLATGGTITLSQDGTSLNLRASVDGSVGSVAFFLDGKLVRTENVAPFALAGDTDGTYHKWTPQVGTQHPAGRALQLWPAFRRTWAAA